MSRDTTTAACTVKGARRVDRCSFGHTKNGAEMGGWRGRVGGWNHGSGEGIGCMGDDPHHLHPPSSSVVGDGVLLPLAQDAAVGAPSQQ